MKQSSLIIKSFFKQLIRYPVKQYYSQPNTIQSSVGLIFKFPEIDQIQSKQEFNSKILSQSSNIENAQLLFVQRAGYHLDKNAYNVVFPGGQCDLQQSDIQACQRQLREQIGISANSQCIHLGIKYLQNIGQIPKNFYYLKKKGKQVHISCHVYCLKSSSYKWEPKLNSDELRKFKWVRIAELLKSQNYKRRNQIKLGVFERMPLIAAKVAKQNITKVVMQQLDLGMDRNLWGLTLYIWSYMLQMSLSNVGSLLKQQQISLVKGFIKSMKTFELDFKPYSLYKYPVLLIASGWHYIYRIKPFTYDST